MLDIKVIRENPTIVETDLDKRGDNERKKILKKLVEDDKKYRELLQEVEDLKHKRNVLSKEIALLKKDNKDAASKLKEAAEIPEKIKKLEEEISKLKENIDLALYRIPNLLHESVPVGKDESENVEIRRWGKPPKFDFEPKSHFEILNDLGMIDAEAAARVSGSLFFFYKGPIVLLDLALQRFALDIMAKEGFQIIYPPFMVNKKVYEGMIGDPTDFAEASYKIEGEELYLIPTAEYPLGGMYIDQTINQKDLPLKLCGVSSCFRKEVGTHGKFSKGLYRMHQFNKVEMIVMCLPEESWDFHEKMQKICESVYQQLGLHYRVVNVCTGDIGTKASKKYDTEIWMADGNFREVGSNSNVLDYQARNLNTKYREKEGQAPKGFVHILNNTVLATSRTMLAILEQYQQKDGTVLIPKVLLPYMGGIKKLEKLK
ncbi:MAG: serine--tRNA ligase [Candidatus Aenigmatarchaeota archaeon]